MDVFKHKPTLVNAFKWTGFRFTINQNVSKLERKPFTIHDNGKLTVMNAEGRTTCSIGDYVIRAGINDYYVCPAEKFRDIYELVDDE